MDTSLLITEYIVSPTVPIADFELHSQCPTVNLPWAKNGEVSAQCPLFPDTAPF